MNRSRKLKGFSLIELMVVVVIVAMLMVVGVTWALPVLKQNRVVSQLVSIKGSFQQARARAIERNAPVLFTYAGNQLHVMGDFGRDGTFPDLVVGESSTQGILYDDSQVKQTNSTVAGPLDHWSGLADLQAIPDFPGFHFIISPTGLIVDDAGHPIRGAFFLINDDDFRGALYISMLGDAKIALKQNGSSEMLWTWND